MKNSYVSHSSPNLPIAKELETAILAGEDPRHTFVWSSTTNRRSCGGLNATAKAVIHRALRKAGWVFFLATYDGGGNQWGLIRKENIHELKSEDIIEVQTGYTLSAAAHKMGYGNANEGWNFYFNHK